MSPALPVDVARRVESWAPERRTMFTARALRWLPDLRSGVEQLYETPEQVVLSVLMAAADAFEQRSDDLHARDLTRMLAPDWFQLPGAVGYAAYTDRYAGTIAGICDRLDHLGALGVTYLHLMPLLRPCSPPNDGGYAVADYESVREDLGEIDDLDVLTAKLADYDISLCLDLVLNHVADEHEWARRARAGEQKYQDYFYLYDDRTIPDSYEATLPEVFPEFAPGNFTFDQATGKWVWTTFNAYQWDVNWSNPEVLCEYVHIILSLANRGVDVLRLDAIAFTWKRLGTNCQNQPEVHALTQVLRAAARIAAPSMVFKAEAIVGPRDLVAYFGTGSHHGKISDLAYHNSLMVQVWSMLASRNSRLATHALGQLAATPRNTAWVTYARCHDDIGWAIDDADAGALGIDAGAHRAFLSDFSIGDFPGSWSRGVVFQHNLETGDRRISGTLASLSGADCSDPLTLSRILLVHSIILGFGGLPVLWMGDEIGLRNDPDWADEPGHEDDNRWIHRPRMPWQPDGTLPDPLGVLPALSAIIGARKATPQLHAAVPSEVLWSEDPSLFLVLRRHPLGPMLGVYNVTDSVQGFRAQVANEHGLGAHAGPALDRLSGVQHPLQPHQTVALKPYGALWLTSTH